MLTMTTLRQIYDTATDLGEHGGGLPAAEQLAWRVLAAQLQEFADQEQPGPAWSPPPEGVAEGVQALHAHLATMDTPVSALAARWVAAWLAECAQHAQRRAQPAQTPAATQQPPARPEPPITGRGSWGTPASRRSTYRPGLQLCRGWAVLLISVATVETLAESRCLFAIGRAATLTCAADDRPWQWRPVGSQVQVRVGPPPTLGHPSAAQVAAELEHLARGLNPGCWRVSTIPAGAR
jgi:hypothetical protein